MGGDDWDLEAVVRSCRFSGSPPATAATVATAATATRDPFSSFPAPFPVDEEEGLGEGNRFPDLLGGSRTISYGLEELCKPFFSKPQQQQQQQQQLQTKPSNSPAAPPAAAPTKPAQQQHRPAHHRPVSQIPRSKRRKNQQKKVVCHVPADGLASDMWAWRKYGQKPIKGSPYPRGYYRCSSSKGCQARKQVERSRADPGILVITYTAEHNHPVPTHRNSLAGSTRSKISTFSAGEQSQLLTGSGSPLSSPTAASGLSPTTPLNASMEDELLRRQAEKSGDEEEEDDEEEEEEEELMVEDMEMAGDGELLFVGIDGEETEIKGNATAVEGSDAFEDQFFSAFLAG